MPRPLTVLHIGNPNAFKNIAICDYFVQRGHDVHFWGTRPLEEDKKLPAGIIAYNLEPERGKRGRSKLLRDVFRLRNLVKSLHPDVVHAHHAYGAGWLGAACGAHTLFLHCYGADVLAEQGGLDRWHKRLFLRYTLQRTNRIIVTGRHMRERLQNDHGVDLGKITVLPRGVDTRVFHPDYDVRSLRRTLNIGGSFRVLFSPRYLLKSVYHIDIVFKAVSAVFNSGIRDIVLIQMYRDSENLKEFQDLSVKLGIGDLVRFVPVVPNREMAAYYCLADLCISVPYSDGFPVTILEASACGTPMIVSDLPFAAEWFSNGENGFVVPVGDENALAGAITRLLGDTLLGRRFREINITKVKNEADYELCMKRLDSLYYEAVTMKISSN